MGGRGCRYRAGRPGRRGSTTCSRSSASRTVPTTRSKRCPMPSVANSRLPSRSPPSPAQLLDLLRGLPADITLIFVEHDLDLVFGLATEVTVLHLGRVLMSGTPAAVQASADVQRAYLGTGRRGDLFSTERSTGGEHVASRA